METIKALLILGLIVASVGYMSLIALDGELQSYEQQELEHKEYIERESIRWTCYRYLMV